MAETTPTYTSAPTGSANVSVAPAWRRPNPALLDAFKGQSTAVIGDALGRLGMPDGNIVPLWQGCIATGSALTVLVTAGDDLAVIDAVGHIQSGDIVVINGFGYTGRAVMGGILARYFAAKGAVGAVVDGAVRDRVEITAQGFPVWSRAVTPAGPWKNGPGTVGYPVAIGGIVVSAGDIIVGDADGLVCIPQMRAPEVLVEVSRIVEIERRLHESVSAVPTTATST